MEILAPAGNRAALERAEAAGADAVYLGFTDFGARAGAGNFNRAELAEAIRYAHLRHMRVHVTLNTLVKDRELERVSEVIRMLQELKADAVLVQDLGILRMIRSLCPDLTVHASTQMAIHNRTGVHWCASQGMRRVVLARECSLAEIAACRQEKPEIEIFVHGAQCVAVSGLCLMSSMAGERSGNRGRCAQPCRTEYVWQGRRGAWLSPRDLCLRDELPAIVRAGVDSVKIEGRLKRPEYAAVVTEIYRRAADEVADGTFAPAGAAEMGELKQIFNRGGFMRGYAFGCEDAGVIDPRGVRHLGVMIGKLEKADSRFALVRLQKDLHDGDQLEIRRGSHCADWIYAGPDAARGETAKLRLRPGTDARKGDQVWRLTDAEQMRRAGERPGRRIEADLFLRAMPGEKMTVQASDGESTVTVTGQTVEAAKTRPAECAELIRSLSRTGDTVFLPRRMNVETEGAFVPVSEVNRLRREALDALADARAEAFAPASAGVGKLMPEHIPEMPAPPRIAYVPDIRRADMAREKGFLPVLFPGDYRREPLEKMLDGMHPGDWLRLPDVCEEATLRMLSGLVDEYAGKLGGVVLGTVGQLGISWPVRIAAGSGIPVMNRQAASLLLDAGCVFVTASPELTGAELRELTAGNAPVVVSVYGRTQLMLLHHCPARTALGLESGHASCTMCDRDDPNALKGTELEDRIGHRFPLMRLRLPEGCLVRLMNALPTDISDRGIAFRAVELTNETPAEAESVLAAVAEGRKTGVPATTGHWMRETE